MTRPSVVTATVGTSRNSDSPSSWMARSATYTSAACRSASEAAARSGPRTSAQRRPTRAAAILRPVETHVKVASRRRSSPAPLPVVADIGPIVPGGSHIPYPVGRPASGSGTPVATHEYTTYDGISRAARRQALRRRRRVRLSLLHRRSPAASRVRDARAPHPGRGDAGHDHRRHQRRRPLEARRPRPHHPRPRRPPVRPGDRARERRDRVRGAVRARHPARRRRDRGARLRPRPARGAPPAVRLLGLRRPGAHVSGAPEAAEGARRSPAPAAQRQARRAGRRHGRRRARRGRPALRRRRLAARDRRGRTEPRRRRLPEARDHEARGADDRRPGGRRRREAAAQEADRAHLQGEADRRR